MGFNLTTEHVPGQNVPMEQNRSCSFSPNFLTTEHVPGQNVPIWNRTDHVPFLPTF